MKCRKLTEVFVYVLDIFIPPDLTRKEVLKAFKEDKLKPFEFIREIVEDKGVRGIKVCSYTIPFSKEKNFC